MKTLEQPATEANAQTAAIAVGSGAVVRRRWNDYAVWRKQRPDNSCASQWIQTGHKLKAVSDKDAQSRLRRVFNGCGFSAMSLIAMPVGETPNNVLDRTGKKS
jgi:hypothetical protein